ncbi:ATP-binding protein [Rhodanobacter sp. Root480]|uniref:ATP-binding protein n=1 Tax=Rhodanobacter sp. Root480 TaxID=1736542 RepID=UPI000A68EF27|nr:ATP-binding protein [Rhodanobacter sp. Root480]
MEETLNGAGAGDASELPFLPDQVELAQFLGDEANSGNIVRTQLKASGRVIARVTDGIYRRPASAFRELISNAWDADANTITILTDAPRFERIHIRDNGNGMSHEVLSRILLNIGGSAKRHIDGQTLGITASNDPTKSPGGRPLIGKIGIGLFSVSQISRRFRIITKVKGASYRLVADVRLRTYSEDPNDHPEVEADDEFISGEVLLVRQAAQDIESQGTDIVLEDVKPNIRDLLRDNARWRLIAERRNALSNGDMDAALAIKVEEPRVHSGWIEEMRSNDTSPVVQTVPSMLPWDAETPANERMACLMDAVEKETESTQRPALNNVLDAYLEMLWTLGLSSPVDYIDSHPFDLKRSSAFDLYWISNDARGQAILVDMRAGESVREAIAREHEVNLEDGLPHTAGPFSAFIDGVELKKPIRYRFRSAGERNLSRALLFVGRYNPNLSRVSNERRGGGLELEAYIYWNGRIVPKENNGVLVRIRGASGALFDPTFFGYQVSELTRLKQITSEIYVRRGLDAALNIDRESFNYSHPHVQLVAQWLQRGVRQLTNKHKDLAKKARLERREIAGNEQQSAINDYADAVWRHRQGDESSPKVVITSETGPLSQARSEGALALSSEIIYSSNKVATFDQGIRQAKTVALVRVLAAFNVLDDRSYREQEDLVSAILELFLGN